MKLLLQSKHILTTATAIGVVTILPAMTISSIGFNPTIAQAQDTEVDDDDDDDDGVPAVPVGGVEAGAGGTATRELPGATVPIILAGGVLLVGAGVATRLRRKSR